MENSIQLRAFSMAFLAELAEEINTFIFNLLGGWRSGCGSARARVWPRQPPIEPCAG
jgi:hypothetical protein